MANSGKQSPLGINVLGSVLQNQGFYINPTAQSYMGVNKSTMGDYTPGKLVNDTCLKWLTYAINDAFKRGETSGGSTVNKTIYNQLLTIGQSRIPALGNSPPPTWETSDPSGVWVNQYAGSNPNTPGYTNNQAGAPANTGYAFYNWTASEESYIPDKVKAYKDEGQLASWYPFLAVASGENVPNVGITQWGWIRCFALQAWNEFNINGKTVNQLDNTPVGSPEYKNFVDSISTADGFINYSNEALYAIEDSQTFLQGTYSNQNDLISADIAGVSLSSRAFGQDLLNLGNAISLKTISTFGLPSNLLITLQNNNALTQPVILALLAAGLTQREIEQISSGQITPTKSQEQKIYGAYTAVTGSDLKTILITLNCRTKGIEFLIDLLNVKKLFPTSYTTLTVPVYNTNPGPTNSKTYYLLFIAQELNPQLVTPKIKKQIGTIVPPVSPPLTEPISIPTVIEIPPQQILPPIQPTFIPIPEVVQPPVKPVPVAPPSPTIPFTGQGPQGGGGGCVALESFIPLAELEQKHNGRDIRYAWMLESGMKISIADDDAKLGISSVKKALNDYQPCIRLITSDGISLICSTTAKIMTKEDGYIPALELYGKRVAVMRNNNVWFDEIVQLESVGMKHVRVIDANNTGFWAGERPGSYILHHNVIVSDTFKYDKV